MDEDWLDPPNPLIPAGSHADPISAQNWERITTKYADVGYREGISEGKLSSLQEGFDGSFRTSVPLVRRLGRLRGMVGGLLGYTLGLGEGKEQMIKMIRELNSDLGRLKMGDVLPVDQEAMDHAKEHLGDDNEDLPREGKEMDELMSAFDGAKVEVAGGPAGGEGSVQGRMREQQLLETMEARLEELMRLAGLI